MELDQDWRERVPELVAENRKEVVLRLIRSLRGGAQPLELLARERLFRDIESDDEDAVDRYRSQA